MLWTMLNWPGSGARLAPGFQAAFRRANICGRRHCRSRRKHRSRPSATARYGCSGVKRLAAHERRRLVRDADGQQHLAVGRALAHGVVAVIGAIEMVVGIDVQAVGAIEQAFAPAPEEIPLAVQHHHRMVAAV